MSKLPPAIVWFRSDLRLRDNDALVQAAAHRRPVLPVYILDDERLGAWTLGGASCWWLHGSLQLPFRTAPAELAALQRGGAGIPIIDAGMRQLWHTGWMHNRVRMVADGGAEA